MPLKAITPSMMYPACDTDDALTGSLYFENIYFALSGQLSMMLVLAIAFVIIMRYIPKRVTSSNW